MATDRTHLADKIKNYMESRQLGYELQYYESGESFAAALEIESFGIVVMDIYMGEMNGRNKWDMVP